jgi:hypothetical protein
MSSLMPRPLLVAALAAFGALPASAQNSHAGSIRPVPGVVRDAGIYHVADGTWTRNASSASLGNDVLYDNTCSPRYFGGLAGDRFIDDGRIPGTASPDSLVSKPGCALSYSVDGFQFAYCTDQSTVAFDVAFYSEYTQCTTVVGVTPAASFSLTGLPARPAGAATFCWTVTVDAAGSPFVISAAATNPDFGFAISSPQSSIGHGPIITGEINTCARWDGTSFDPVVNLAEAGTGMGNDDLFRIESGPTTAGCYWFGGNPYGGFWLELYGSSCAPDGNGQAAFCVAGDFGTNACPCAVQPAPGSGGGCVNSFGGVVRLGGSGNASLANDTVVLAGSGLPSLSSALYFQGTLRHNAGLGFAFGDGLRCAGGTVTRLGTKISSAGGTSQYPDVGDASVSVRGGVAAPGTRTYQIWYRNIAPFCTPAAFNTSNGWEIYWGA